MEERNSTKVCVTRGSGYIASCLVKKLLEKGYTVHATLRNLDTRLVLFQADTYNPSEFEPAIEGCHYVFHLATPWQHNAQSSEIMPWFKGGPDIGSSCDNTKMRMGFKYKYGVKDTLDGCVDFGRRFQAFSSD